MGEKNLAAKKAASTRHIAFLNLKQVLNKGGYAHLVVPASLKKYQLSQVDKSLVVELSYGVLRRKLTLDWLINCFYHGSLKKLQPDLLNILRLGVYQLLFLKKVPAYASINEAVNLAKKLLNPGAGSLVNAVLRKIEEQKDKLPWPSREDLTQYLAVIHSHPAWLVALWLKELGLKETEALLAANNRAPTVTLRINSLKTNRQEVIDWLKQNNIPYSSGKFFPEALILKGGQPPEELIKQGFVYVQDEASMAVAHALGPLPGETVIDLASGPGGKTTHLAALMENKGQIYAVELNKKRLNLVRKNCQTLGVTNVKYIHGDATLPLKLPLSEKLLVDAPCSGLGVLARRPDLRWRKSLNDIEQLAKLQQAILAKAATYVKKQGTLVYAACTISKKETVEVVEQFLKTHPEFRPVKLQLNKVSAEFNSWLQFMPHKHGTDGFFIAKLKKV